ncbi:cysteine hydrolase family protein [Pseudoxanthomonas mexicana]|uniref:cysteine hydrolase family protein n=1 Tax=Pseudoxanthomonas mexicana TaxID=128785 RepID=UPI00209D2857|nr:isochorismatase family cysteine hydrolase [Pseudoxanthomonas mexicana]MCP1582389.1 nicotinamidase-related amidase [Pseudoxanthomonas mexicana]
MSDTALLVLDMVNRFDFEGGDRLAKAARAIVPRIETLRARFDAAGAPTIYVNDNFSHWQGQFGDLVAACRDAGGASASIMQRLAPRPHDYHVLKPKHSGFLATPLAILLAKLGARRLVLTGLSADSCVLATAQGANMREYEIWVPQDAVAAITPARRRHALQVMAEGLGARVDAVRAVTGLFPDPA